MRIIDRSRNTFGVTCVGAGRALLSVLGTLILFCGAADASLRPGFVKLPVIDKQDIGFIPLTVDGRSLQARIWSITQDNYGFLWLGTSDGLYRYDGYSLKRYRNERDTPNSLGSDPIRAECRDRTGVLWFGTANEGLYRLDPTQDSLTHYRHERGHSRSLSGDWIRCVYQDRTGALWIGSNGGLDRLDQATGTFVHYRHDSQDTGGPSDNVESVFEDRRGNLWVCTQGGLYKLDRATGRFSRLLNDAENPHSLSQDYVNFMLEDKSGVLWLASPFKRELSALDVKTGRFTHYPFGAEEPGSQSVVGASQLFEDEDGALWVCTVDRGLLKLDRDRKRFLRYARDADNPNSLPNDTVATVFEDAEGVLWVGTQNGLSRFQSRPSPFVTYKHQAGDPKSLHGNMIWCAYEDSKGLLWIGTEDGLNRLDRQTGQLTFYHHDPNNPHSLSYDKVAVIREDRSGALWFGAYGGGLNRFDRTTGRFFAYRHDERSPGSLSSNAVLSLLLDRQGVVWVGTQSGGLNRLDAGTGRFTAYPTGPGSVTVLFEDRAGMLWMGGPDGGLNRFDPRTEQFSVYRHDPQDPRTLSDNKVNAIWEDQQGVLWIGTQNGLNELDRSRGIFTIFTTKDGLPGNAISAILEDTRGYLWLATHDGLSRFNPRTRIFRNYSESDGLPNNFLNPYSAGSSFQSQAGEMFIGSSKGLTTFYPDRLSDNPHLPPVVLTDLRLFNKPVSPGADSPLQQPLWATNSLTLTHKQGIFTLEFAALSYTAPENNRYRYRLEGLETEWNEVDSRQRLATYTNLPAGAYTFRVQGSNNDQIWNENGVTLAITILPPWWATWWFRSLTGLIIVGGVLGAYWSRVRSLQLGAARLEAEVAERTGELMVRTRELQIAKDAAETANRAKNVFLASMSHELRTPLNAILGFTTLLREGGAAPEEQGKDLDIISRSGEHLLHLIDDVLDMAKIEAGRSVVESGPCDVQSLVRDLTEMMRMRAMAKNLQLLVEQSPGFPRRVRTDAAKLRQILTNLIGNAVKYTERGGIMLRLNGLPEDPSGRVLLQFEVEDTGVGIAAKDQGRVFEPFVRVGDPGFQDGTGLGLAIVRQYVELMGGTIRLESEPGRGSRFRMELPVERVPESEATAPLDYRPRVVRIAFGQREYRVLIVEDQFENRLLLRRLLERVGFSVRATGDGQEGIEIFKSWRPHFIWMDRGLHGMDGLETVRRIRRLGGGREVKIVAVTASVLAGERDEMLASGLDDFLGKPYRLEEIFDCMARHMGVRYDREENGARQSGHAKPILRPEAWAAIPEGLRKEMADAVIALDSKRISGLIRRISELDPALGGVLEVHASRLAYTPILNALRW